MQSEVLDMSDIRLAPTVFIATDSSAMEAVLDLQMRIRRHNEVLYHPYSHLVGLVSWVT